jgi:hypothetical protein
MLSFSSISYEGCGNVARCHDSLQEAQLRRGGHEYPEQQDEGFGGRRQPHQSSYPAGIPEETRPRRNPAENGAEAIRSSPPKRPI